MDQEANCKFRQFGDRRRATRTIRLNVVGFRARLWLGRVRPCSEPFRDSNAEGGWDMYSDEIGPVPLLSTAFPGEVQGLWNGTVPLAAENDVFAAPLGGGGSSCGSSETSTRLLGHGMPCAESSGSDGEERMNGGPPSSDACFWGLRRKLNMVVGVWEQETSVADFTRRPAQTSTMRQRACKARQSCAPARGFVRVGARETVRQPGRY